MDRLDVQMHFSPPEGDRPSLPQASSSLFGGRIFFVPTEEDLHVNYSGFARTGPGN
jgi:hypothetical protein